MSSHDRLLMVRTGLFTLTAVSAITCTDAPTPTGAAEQAVVNPPLPGNLDLALNARTTVTIGPFARVFGDVASTGANGSVVFDVSSSQDFGRNVLANTVRVLTSASVGHVFGNDITVDGFDAQQTLGLDPGALPPVPAVTPAAPGTTNLTVAANQARQLCPGQYGAISLGVNATLNLNGGVYQLSRLSLADGARLEPSEPVVLLISGGVTTGIGASIVPSAQALNPMSAADIRLEVGAGVTLGDSTQVRAHLLLPNGKLTTGKNTTLSGAAWAKTISIGAQSFVASEGGFRAQTPVVPPPCNDNNACTTDQCVGSGTAVAFCRNTALPAGSSCEDGNICNGAERCDASAQCQPAAPASAGTACPDGDACNGDETCNGFGSCVPGTPPAVNDGNACTADACDPATGVSHDPVADGTTCSGVGVCEAGTCSVAGTVFSEEFFPAQGTAAQCDRWNDFLFNQLVDGSYGTVSVNGTFDQPGVTCSDPTSATQICQALHHGGFASVFCGGHVWNVGQCGGTELSIDVSVCFCNFSPVRTVRPCTGTDVWGGLNTASCNAPSQTMTVVCE